MAGVPHQREGVEGMSEPVPKLEVGGSKAPVSDLREAARITRKDEQLAIAGASRELREFIDSNLIIRRSRRR